MLIGEVARRSGVSTRMLRHYDALGLVRPTGRTVGGYREYADADIRRIFHVESLRSLGLSLRQIGRALEDPAFTPSDLVADLIRRTEERVRREQELLARLRAVDASAPTEWEGVLGTIELLRALTSPDPARRQQAVLAPADDVPVPLELLADAVLAEADANVAGALRWALARTGADGVAAMAAALSAPDEHIRRRAVLALSEIPGEESSAALAPALTDQDPAVRRYAALALGGRGVTDAMPVLLGMVVDGINDVEAAEVLGSLASNHGFEGPIVEALFEELDAHSTAVRIRVAQALAEIPSEHALRVLRMLSRDGDATVAMIASAFVTMRAPDTDPAS